MKRMFFFTCTLFLAGLILSSCQRQPLPQDETYDEAQLRAGTWTVDKIVQNSFDGSGNLIDSETIFFGQDQPGGICTFTYDDSDWTMNDNGEVFTSGYRLEGRVVYTDDGGDWGIREMNDERLEIVQRGDEVRNPCQFNVSGSVYYLSRNAR